MPAFDDYWDMLDYRPVSTGPQGEVAWVLRAGNDGTRTWRPEWMHPDGDVTYPVFAPLPGSQQLFLECPYFEALLEGERGPGKTLVLLMDYARDVGKGHGSAWRGAIFRRHYKDLDDVVRKIDEWFPRIFGDTFRILRSKAEYMAVWESGEALLLRQAVDETDYEAFHGHEYPWIAFEELTQWEDSKFFLKMQSCCRAPRQGVPTRVRSTTNPYGPGHNWVKRRYGLPQSRGRVIRLPGQMPRVAIHARLDENFVLLNATPEYRTQVIQAAGSPAEEKAWVEGDWNVTSGGMIDDLWDPRVHVVRDFDADRVPKSWRLTRAYDHGQSHPFSVGWFFESSGEPFEWGGRLLGRVRGDVILWREWYGRVPKEENVGLRMSARQIAQGIADREQDWGVKGKVAPGPADTEIWNAQSDRDGRSPADDMEDAGVYWVRADKTRGSRVRGWQMMRSMLDGAIPNPDGTREEPGFFVCEGCRDWLELVPPMPRSPDDLDDVPKTYEDHSADMTRYRLSWQQPYVWRKTF